MLLFIGQILSLSVIPMGILWYFFMIQRGHEMTPELDHLSQWRKWPKWFYLAPVGGVFWIIGLVIVFLAKG